MKNTLLALVVAIQATYPENFKPAPLAYSEIEKKYFITFTYDLPDPYRPLVSFDIIYHVAQVHGILGRRGSGMGLL